MRYIWTIGGSICHECYMEDHKKQEVVWFRSAYRIWPRIPPFSKLPPHRGNPPPMIINKPLQKGQLYRRGLFDTRNGTPKKCKHISTSPHKENNTEERQSSSSRADHHRGQNASVAPVPPASPTPPAAAPQATSGVTIALV